MKKIRKILLNIFSIGGLFSLFAGGIAIVGFIFALLIGGETATEICLFIHKQYFPCIIRICSISVGVGLTSMYMERCETFRKRR